MMKSGVPRRARTTVRIPERNIMEHFP
jgi:hypothetical protein